MNAVTHIPNRNELELERKTQAQLYLREFDPKVYSTFYARVYDAEAYLEQIGIEKICELIEHGGSVFEIAERIDLSVRTLRAWIHSKPYYKKEVEDAYKFAADGFAYKAERILKNGPYGDKVNAKLSDHYRWLATKLDRERYGESSKQESQAARAPLSINLNFGGEVPKEKLVKQAAPLVAEFMKLSEEES